MTPPEAGGLHAAHRRAVARVSGRVALVDVDGSGADAGGNGAPARDILRPDGGVEAEVGVIGEGDGLVIAAHAVHADDGPECLLVAAQHAVRDAVEDGRFVAVRADVGARLASDQHRRALRDGVVDVRLFHPVFARFMEAGEEGERIRRLLVAAPKYGNDDDSVDLLLARAYQTYIEELKQYHNPRYGRGPVGGNYYAGTSSISANVPFGAATMATPDGRKAHTPLAEGASPASGTDHLGPTAVIGSVGKLPTGSILGGVLLNQKLNPATLENESDKQKLMILLRTFFEEHKGWHIQYNIVSRETLLEAKKHPDQYRDLVVRVAGYSAFFTALSPDAQDDIIARTEHML